MAPHTALGELRDGSQRGYTYLLMLFVVAVSTVMLAKGAAVWSHENQRERERELLQIGEEFRQAIGLYYERSSGPAKTYPAELADLLADPRALTVQRYLRRVYRDPITGTQEWGLIRDNRGGIMGVHSLSQSTPVFSGSLSTRKATQQAMRHSDWKFVYLPYEVASPVP